MDFSNQRGKSTAGGKTDWFHEPAIGSNCWAHEERADELQEGAIFDVRAQGPERVFDVAVFVKQLDVTAEHEPASLRDRSRRVESSVITVVEADAEGQLSEAAHQRQQAPHRDTLDNSVLRTCDVNAPRTARGFWPLSHDERLRH